MTAVNAASQSVPPHGQNPASSPRPQTAASTASSRAGNSIDATGASPGSVTLERQPSISYSHHRQTSIVHGIQHSRNTSFAQAPALPAWTSQLIAAKENSHLPEGALRSPLNDLNNPISPLTMPASSASHGFGSGSVVSLASTLTPDTGTSKRPLGRQSSTHRQQHSGPRYAQLELKTVGEYALHVLFSRFVGQAERKINDCLARAADFEPQAEQICGAGVDPAFDQLIGALAHIARQKPKPLIDTLIHWRKAKSEAAKAARAELLQYRATAQSNFPYGMKRGAESSQTLVESYGTTKSSKELGNLQAKAVDTDRRSALALYILCRVLIEVIGQTSLAAMTPETADSLEELIFTQLRSADPQSLHSSPLRNGNWTLFAQLLGIMSNINFENVSDRFFTELEKLQREAVSKIAPTKNFEGTTELIVRGMGYLSIKMYPDDLWEQSCDFLIAFSKFFGSAHGERVKHTYLQVLPKFLMPIAAKANLELNAPKWKTVVESLHGRVTQVLQKPRYWQDGFPLMAIIICVSPAEIFATQWTQFIAPLQPKLKDRITRGTALQAISRLVWVYLYRCPETLNSTVKKLDEIIKMVFPFGKKSYLSTEIAIADPLIQLIRIIGYKHQDLCFRTIVFPLLNSELFQSGRDLKVENLDPERMVIGIRAFLAIMSDLEKGPEGKPPFPQGPADFFLVDKVPASPMAPQTKGSRGKQSISKLREERLSKPVLTATFPEVTKEYYVRFCEILGKITLMCDNAFGGQATLDEKFSIQPKTPMTDSFSFRGREDPSAVADQRQGFYDLLHVAIQALPRCLSPNINFNSLINLLCTGTAHVQTNIAASSAQSLKSIARQNHAQHVTVGFGRFIFNFDNQYSTMSDGGMLGPAHVEKTLKLYVELLQIWIEEIRQKTAAAAASAAEDSQSRGAQLDLSGIFAYVDDIEAHGLFFLCSQSKDVRSFAIAVLKLIVEFDTALGKDNTRVIHILKEPATTAIDLNDEQLTVAERSRLQQQGSDKNVTELKLFDLTVGANSYDTTLWFKVFPTIIRMCFERCPFAMTLGRDIVCNRLQQMQRVVLNSAEVTRQPQYTAFDLMGARPIRQAPGLPDGLVEQWKLYLIVACTTLTNSGAGQLMTQAPIQHTRKASKPPLHLPSERITTAKALFGTIIPLMSVASPSIREAVVLALGSININLYKTLLETMQSAVAKCNEEARQHMTQKMTNSPRRSRRTDRLRTEITHVYKRTSHFLKHEVVFRDEWILGNLVSYTQELKRFLSDVEIQNDWEFQKLRRHYCGLMEALFEGINQTPHISRWMPFEARKSAFILMEDWCGYGPNQAQIAQREEQIRQILMEQQRDSGDKGSARAQIEIEKRNLRTAALSAMATLCAGPVTHTDHHIDLGFDIRRLINWIDMVFTTPSDKIHKIGLRALKNVILHNRDSRMIVEWPIHMMYTAASPKALESYLEVVTEIAVEQKGYPVSFSKIISASLFTLGDDLSNIRSQSVLLLRTLEELQQQKNSRIQDFEISVADKTTAVFKLAQFEISKRLSARYPELAFHVFSEFCLYFKDLPANKQRNMVAALLPWIQTIELKVDGAGHQTAESYMLLANLFEITIKCGNALHNEVQALWQALATGPYISNIQLISDFVISACMDRREQNFVDYAKQIVVFLANTSPGLRVVELLLLQITPRAMVLEKREPVQPPEDTNIFPYTADLDQAVPVGGKNNGYSLGQLALIFLVDLMVGSVNLSPDKVPVILHTVLVLWDHYTPLVQDHAREMLIHLIHELVVSKLDEEESLPSQIEIQNLIDMVRQREPKTVWGYEEEGRHDDDGLRVPKGLEYIASAVVQIFTIAYPNIKEQWGTMSLKWATTCPVRHMACRSFQVFRCISTSLEQSMLADMLARLSNTVAEEQADFQTFSMEILTTLKSLIHDLSSEDLKEYPQLFWTTYACLNTIHEREFLECLYMLDEYTNKLSLDEPDVLQKLLDGFPPDWEGNVDALPTLLYKGLRSSVCMVKTLELLDKLIHMQGNDLIGDDSRLLFGVLGNLPRFLHSMDQNRPIAECLTMADKLAKIAEAQARPLIARALNGFANNRYRASKDFLSQILSALREAFFPIWDYPTLIFLMGLLPNSISWFKLNTMRILCVILPEVDTRKPEIATHGPDLISPLLRLLQTEYCPQALEVLDQVMTMSATPMDKHHLRMSMAGPQSKAIRKEYEFTQSLFGIPEDSGWSIPMPAVYSQTTRDNVQKVFHTCVTAQEDPSVATPDVEFHTDDYQFTYPVYGDRTGTMLSVDAGGEVNMGDLVMTLDSLDNIFEVEPNGAEGQQLAQDAHDQALYDQHAIPMMRRSSERNGSINSLQSSYMDSRAPYGRDFHPGHQQHYGSQTSLRKPSIPSIPFPTASGVELLSDDDDDEEEDYFPLEPEDTSGRPSLERDTPGDHLIKAPPQGSKPSRRLTGGSTKEKEREREILRAQAAATGQIPKSPQVPESYLKPTIAEKLA